MVEEPVHPVPKRLVSTSSYTSGSRVVSFPKVIVLVFGVSSPKENEEVTYP